MSILHQLNLSSILSLSGFDRCLNGLDKDLSPHSGR
jgi:hypothetical protein